MTINKFTAGVNTSFSTELNENLAASLRQNGLNLIQQFQDRAITLSADGGVFAEVYTDSDGRDNSVVAADTDATFDTDKYYADGTGDDLITHRLNPTAFSTTLSTAFMTFKAEDWESGADVQFKLTAEGTTGTEDGVDDTETWATNSTSSSVTAYYGSIIDLTLGCFLKQVVKTGTCTATKAYVVRGGLVVAEATFSTNTATFSPLVALYSDDFIVAGSDGSSYTRTLNGSASYPYTGTNLDATGGVSFDSATKATSINTSTTYNVESIVVQTSDTALVSEDTGYLSTNEAVSFTALTIAPQKAVVKLIPKTTSPTANYPSINGVVLYGAKP